jgi:vacuolar-type H+-ATPase subunit I/STV1
MDDQSSAWAYITGGGFVTLLVALGGGIKYLFDLRKAGKDMLEEHRDGVLKDYKEIAQAAQEELERVRAGAAAEMARIRNDHAAERTTWAAALAAKAAETTRERAWSMYHLALADFWHARSRLLWHFCTNWDQFAFSLTFFLRGFVARHPEEVPKGLPELLDAPPAKAEEPPPFLSPTEALAKMRPKEPDLS